MKFEHRLWVSCSSPSGIDRHSSTAAAAAGPQNRLHVARPPLGSRQLQPGMSETLLLPLLLPQSISIAACDAFKITQARLAGQLENAFPASLLLSIPLYLLLLPALLQTCLLDAPILCSALLWQSAAARALLKTSSTFAPISHPYSPLFLLCPSAN